MCVVNAVLEGGLAGSYDNSIAIMCCVGWKAQEILRSRVIALAGGLFAD